MTCTETTRTSEIYSNPCSYVCERLPLKYTQTRVCRNSFMGTCTVPDSCSCLCERSLSHCFSWGIPNPQSMERFGGWTSSQNMQLLLTY